MEAQQIGYGGNMYDVLDNDNATQALKKSLSDLSGVIKATKQAHMAAGQQTQQGHQQADQLIMVMQTVQQMAASMQGLQQQAVFLANQ